MKRKLILTNLLCILTFLAACSSGSKTNPSSDELLPDAYGKLYEQTVKERADDNTIFSLILLDHDDTPELAVYDQCYENLSIYTIKENKVVCLLDAMHAAEVTYYEQTGILAKFVRWNGGGDEGGYGWYYFRIGEDQTLTDESAPLLYNTYDAVYDEKGEFTGRGITLYYEQGQKIEKEEYHKILEKLGVNDHGKSCTEEAMGIDEIKKLLK